MLKPDSGEPPLEAEAVVHRVDPVSRELAALVGRVPVAIYVPPDCDVVLRGERIKLRMVQPGDRVRMTYTKSTGTIVALSIEVQFDRPNPSVPG